MVKNDYTFVSTRGSSVVDYCVTPYELLSRFKDFNVIRISDLIQRIDIADKIDLRKIVPDHSLLSWTLTLDFGFVENTDRNEKTKIKFDTRNIPHDWLTDENVTSNISKILSELEVAEVTQTAIDNMYIDFVDVLKAEMSKKLPQRTVLLSGSRNKSRKCQKTVVERGTDNTLERRMSNGN